MPKVPPPPEPEDGPINRAARFKQEIGNLIRARRNELDLTQADLAEQIGVSQQQIGKYEKGTDRVPTETFLLLSSILRFDVGSVLYPMTVTDSEAGGFMESDSTAFGAAAFADRDTVALVRAFQSITDKKVRKKVLDLVATMADTPLPPPASGYDAGPATVRTVPGDDEGDAS